MKIPFADLGQYNVLMVNVLHFQCDRTCGEGVQQRLVRCQDHLGQTLPDTDCSPSERPVNVKKCNQLPSCQVNLPPKYHWRKSEWSQCSKSCGEGGITKRSVQCVNLNSGDGVVVPDFRCILAASKRLRKLRSHNGKISKRFRIRKPKTRARCNQHHCPFRWLPDQWSQCSHSCGHGVKHRRVTCHRVNSYGWPDPDQVSHGCNMTEKPKEVETCIINEDCTDQRVLWQVGPWSGCSWEGKGCGKKGKQRRTIHCVDSNTGRRVRKTVCKEEYRKKPRRTQKCAKKICGFESCLDLRQKTGIRLDGEYKILFAGKNITIYCHNMNSTNSSPKEYLTLHAGEYNACPSDTLIYLECCKETCTKLKCLLQGHCGSAWLKCCQLVCASHQAAWCMHCQVRA